MDNNVRGQSLFRSKRERAKILIRSILFQLAISN